LAYHFKALLLGKDIKGYQTLEILLEFYIKTTFPRYPELFNYFTN